MSFLVEPGIESFLHHNLKTCQLFKQEYYNTLINMSLFAFFITFTSAILLYKYKGKPTPQQIEEQNIMKQNYILDKIKKTQEERHRLNEELITDLPHWNRDFYAFL